MSLMLKAYGRMNPMARQSIKAINKRQVLV
jgi:hypothetical protein